MYLEDKIWNKLPKCEINEKPQDLKIKQQTNLPVVFTMSNQAVRILKYLICGEIGVKSQISRTVKISEKINDRWEKGH